MDRSNSVSISIQIQNIDRRLNEILERLRENEVWQKNHGQMHTEQIQVHEHRLTSLEIHMNVRTALLGMLAGIPNVILIALGLRGHP